MWVYPEEGESQGLYTIFRQVYSVFVCFTRQNIVAMKRLNKYIESNGDIYMLVNNVRHIYYSWVGFKEFPVLLTQRLRLRQAELRDVPHILENHSNESVMKYLGIKKLSTMEEAESLIKDAKDAFKEKEGIRWAITQLEDDVYIGSIGLRNLNKPGLKAEVGYELAFSAWGNGLMTEALAAVITFAFTKLKIPCIEAYVDPDNKASSRVLEKLGFDKIGLSKGAYQVNGKSVDTIVYNMPRHESEK